MFTQISPRAFLSLVLFVSAVFLGTLAFARVPRSETRRDAVGHRKTPTTSPSLAAGNSGPGWAIVTSQNTTEQRLVSVACVSGTDCWAAGYYVNTNGLGQTLIEHWDGSSWKIVASPNQTVSNTPADSRLESIACTSTSNCWAVGSSLGSIQTLVEHWDGTFWSIVPSANPSTANNQLHAVACPSAVDCWAVGTYKTGLQNRYTQTLIEHWDGSSWSAVTSPNTGSTLQNRLNGVTCTSASDCWAVGYARTSATNQPAQTLVQHWDGTVWTIVTSPNVFTTQDNILTSVTCSSATDCWAVGYYNSGNLDPKGSPIYQTLIERWNNAAWLIVSSPNTSALDANFLLDVACVSSTQCWSVGYAYGSTSEQALIEQWNGSAWSIVAAPTSQDTQYNYLYGVTCASASQCWATGYSEFQHTLTERWDGSTWTIVPSPSAVGGGSRNVLFDVACSAPSDCWAVGENSVGQSFIQHWNGKIWSQVFVPFSLPALFNSLSGVTCTAANNCWAVGSYDDGNFNQTLIEHWDGNSWSQIISPNTSSTQGNFLSDVTCASASNCWAVGHSYDYNSQAGQTLILHWNGSSWTITPSPNGTALTSGSLNVFSSVACSSSSDCWAAGYTGNNNTATENTLLEHWDGSSWTIVASPNVAQQNFLQSISCLSPSDCWAVGYDQTPTSSSQSLIEHWDGSTWSIVASPSPTNYSIFEDVACTSSSNCWVVGYGTNGTLIAHWDGNSWSLTPSPNKNPSASSTLHAVTCSSDSSCWAVGEYVVPVGATSIGQTLIEEYSLAVPPLINASSRKSHGTTGTFDVDLPIIGKRGVECRSGGQNGNYSVVFTFVNDVTNCGSAGTAGGTIVPGPNSNQCTENLTGVANAQYVNVELDNVVDSQNNTGNVAVSMGVLIADTNADGFVDSADIGQTKSWSGIALSLSNFRGDINADGFIDSADIGFVKSKSGTSLPSLP